MAFQSDDPSSTANTVLAEVYPEQPSGDSPAKPDHSGSSMTGRRTEETISSKIQGLTDALLQWLSNASNESLGACLVGLGASTYFVLGRIGLVLIGIVGGIILHATWEVGGQSHEGEDAKALEIKRRREVGLDVVRRVLDWREKELDEQSRDTQGDLHSATTSPSHHQTGYASFRPATETALNGLTDAVIRDYVKWWYSPLLPGDDTFPTSCRMTLVNFILSFSTHLSRKRPSDTFIDFLTNSSSIIVVFMNELSSALMAPGAHNIECSDALHRYLEMNPDSHLANVMDVEQQQRKLKAVAEDALHSFLDSSAYKCEPVKAFLREVLAGLILETTVQSCSKPDFINGWIIYLLEEGDTELMDVIDAGVSTATGQPNTKVSAGSTIDAVAVEPNGAQGARNGDSKRTMEHRRTISRAEGAMEEAMQEAKRLTELIAAEEAKKDQDVRIEETTKSQDILDTQSSSATTPNGPTPNSSASDLAGSVHNAEGRTMMLPILTTETPVTASFTNFDQILPVKQATALQESNLSPSPTIPPLTLYNATVSIFDDAQPGEKSTMRSKPQADYLIQIEPATPQHPGWMIARRYPDFETLHEVLRRISVVSGVPDFAYKHSTLPGWKSRTKAELRGDLERYIRDALSFSRLAESEGMKRFLEKDQAPGGSGSSGNKGGFGFPSPAAFENMGKGMLDVLASAPKGAAGGGKAILGGFTGVVGGLGSIGQRKPTSISPSRPSTSDPRASTTISRAESYEATYNDLPVVRQSNDSVRESYKASGEVGNVSPTFNHPRGLPSQDNGGSTASQSLEPPLTDLSTNGSLLDPFVETPETRLDRDGQPELHLPPPPSEISDDYNSSGGPQKLRKQSDESLQHNPPPPTPSSTGRVPPPPVTATPQKSSLRPAAQPLTEPETRVAVELFFALINELYTLSSAWNIRRTLLNAAKSFLLRPGNPSLSSIQQLLQSSLDTNTSDEGIAAHLTKLRENSLPTEVELKKWPTPPDEEEKEELRRKARKLLVEKGMPSALTSVMGAAASGEALGRVFDSLQVQSVARGFMFAIILQAIRALAQ